MYVNILCNQFVNLQTIFSPSNSISVCLESSILEQSCINKALIGLEACK